MKIKHKVPACAYVATEPISEEYQAEVDRTMARAEVEYRRAEKRLRSAEARLARVKSGSGAKNRRRQLAELEALVELRRVELEQIHRLMASTAFPSVNRGRKSRRHVPNQAIPL